MSKVLYVTDLDGTLLRSDENISAYSCSVINKLVEKGMIFSYATARSLVTAKKVTSGINAAIPVIVYNGASVIDNLSKAILISNFFSECESYNIEKALLEFGIYPIVYSYVDGIEKFSYLKEHTNSGMDFFLNSRKDDIRRNPVESIDALYRGNTFYFTCIGEETELLPVYDFLKDNESYNCIYQRDIYSDEQWLEILPSKATKTQAILQLKELLQCDKVVSFGDGKNDISMFKISDECYAVENADDELKAIATDIIESNELDGVARWLDSKDDFFLLESNVNMR